MASDLGVKGLSSRRGNSKSIDSVSAVINLTWSSSHSSAFLLALESIHSAGVRHRDLRPPNLVVNDNTGEVAIIDFDRAHLDLTDDAASFEVNKLEDVLDGEWFDDEVSVSAVYHRTDTVWGHDDTSRSESESPA